MPGLCGLRHYCSSLCASNVQMGGFSITHPHGAAQAWATTASLSPDDAGGSKTQPTQGSGRQRACFFFFFPPLKVNWKGGEGKSELKN